MAKLFISHSSEDKDAFVRPLAEALSRNHAVWYDEYQLNVGDSLRVKIDEGLRTCDFGVVVLSRSFFSKNWTQNELDALFALESTHRKIILPVWYDITKEELVEHSPMLAGRLGALASKGLDVVVNELLRAIEVSERTKQISEVKQGKVRLLALATNLNGKEYEEQFFRSTKAVSVFLAALEEVYHQIRSDIDEVNSSQPQPRFRVDPKSSNERITVYGPHRVCLLVTYRDLYMNSIADAKVVAVIYVRGEYSGAPSDRSLLQECPYAPRCREGENLRWIPEGSEQAVSTTELSQLILASYSKEIEDRHEYDGGG